MNKIISVGLALGAAWFLVGCGGGSSDPETVTKVIVDDPIVELGYKCSSSDKMQKTNEKGEFTCNVGDRVTFYIGQYEIGSADASSGSADTMRIADLLDEEGDAAVTDIRQVLQTIDEDGTDGVIRIPDDFDDLDEVTVKPGDDNFDDAVGRKLEDETGESLIDGETADKNADEAYQKYLLAGKTFYFVSHKYPHPTLMEVRFDETLSKASYFKDSVAVSENTLDLDGSQITQAGDAPIVFTAEEKPGYILVHAKKNGHPFDAKMYSKKSDAQAQYDEETAGDTDLKSLLAGKTFYFATPDGMTKAVFSADFTQVTMTDYNADGTVAHSKTEDIDIDGEKLITDSNGDYIKFKSSFDDYLLFEVYSADNQKEGEARAYTDRAKAEAYLASVSGGGSSSEEKPADILGGKTFYDPAMGTDSNGEMQYFLNTVEINKELTELKYTSGDTGEVLTYDLELKEDKLYLDGDVMIEIIEYVEGKKVTLEITHSGATSGGASYQDTYYLDREEAEEELGVWREHRTITEAKIEKAIIGKTLHGVFEYAQDERELVALKFGADGVVTKTAEDQEEKETETYKYSIKGKKILIEEEGYEEYEIEVTYISDTQVRILDTDRSEGYQIGRYFYSKSEAESNPNIYYYVSAEEETGAGDTDLKSLLAGKTFYFATPDGMTKAVFSADFTQVTTTDYGADGKADSPETDAVEVDGEKFIMNESGDYIKFKSSFDDYLLFEIYSADNQKEGEARAYTDRAKAEAYVNSGNQML